MCGVYLSIKGLRCEEFISLLRDFDVRSLSLY